MMSRCVPRKYNNVRASKVGVFGYKVFIFNAVRVGFSLRGRVLQYRIYRKSVIPV